ncbi:hypothetical protein M2347_000800 [Chryseobacterium sp. H1D6B]|uniref:hypothetical protein n=1 Tax=Chryseobacterium sp. H1D6B TaxID=2940588 RepID=UPI0015CBEBD5|nr:hypothetical protein [Chryseobacterium sp. H1D6B]MDH6251073.1 hypothetical protein [Chryseobacterium sp. H1D6B]
MKNHTLSQHRVQKLGRQKLKSIKAGEIPRRVCCTSNEDNQCCEWASDIWNCRYIQC